MAQQFKGTVDVDIRDSVPDWGPFEPTKAPPGSPNVVYVVLDDVGCSAMSCYGGPIQTPNIDRVAAEGMRCTQWHTTALCSPTRSCLLTGRNHTRNSMSCITEAASGFPNASGTIPRVEPLRGRRLGALPHRRRPGAAPRPRGAAPGKGPRAGQRLVRRGRRQRRLPAGRPVSPRDHPDSTPAAVAAARPLRLPPGTAEVPESQAVNIRARSYAIGALVDIPTPGAEGVIFAHGARFDGHTLYVKDDRLRYVYNYLGWEQQTVVATEDLPVGENLILSAASVKDGEDATHSPLGVLSIYHGETLVGEGKIKTQPGKFSLVGAGPTIGRDSGEPYVDLEREAQAMMMRE